MIILYDKNTTSFNNLGIGVLKDFKSEPLITEVLNGLFNLEFDYVRNGWLSEYLIEGNIVKANGQVFRIWNIKKSTDETKITVLAKHIFFDLEKSNFLEDVAPTNKTGHIALAWLLEHTKIPNNFIVTGDCTKIASARYVRTDPINAIYNADNCILKRFGGELEIDNYNITLHNKRGNDLGLEIRQKKNLKGANYDVDLSTVATRIMPIGKDGILLPEKYIDSPLLNNYFAPFYYKYEVDVGVDEENGITIDDVYRIMRESVQDLFDGGIDKPSISITIDFVELSKTKEYEKYLNLEKAHLGDSCKVYIPSLNLNLTTRIVKTVYNCSKKRITNIELGMVKPNYVTAKVDSDNALKNAVEQVNTNSILEQARENATSLLKHPFKGYLHISESTGEFYLMDTTDINTAQNIWKFGLGGIGHSSTGINGTFETAITQDGQIVADFITTGKLNTNLIEGYKELITTISEIQTIVEETIEYFRVDLDAYNIVIPTNYEGYPLETKDYIINVSSFYLGTQVNPEITFTGENVGIEKSTTDNKIILSTNLNNKIVDLNNEININFKHLDEDGKEYITSKKIVVTLAKQGIDGKDATIQSNEPPTDTSQLWFDTTTNQLKRFDGAIWIVANDYTDDINNLNNNLTNIENNLSQQLQNQKNEITMEYKAWVSQQKEGWEYNVVKAITENGVNRVNNTMVTIDIEGIKVAVNTDELNTLLSNLGFYMKDGNTLVSKLDKDGMSTTNVKYSGSLESKYTKTECGVDENGEKCENTYWIGD